MAAPELGSFTPSPTGNTDLLTTSASTPVYIEFWVGNRSSTTETTRSLRSTGEVDIANGNATWLSNYSDSTHFFTDGATGASSSTPCLRHYEAASSKKIELKFVSAGAGTFRVNVVTASSSYDVKFRVYY